MAISLAFLIALCVVASNGCAVVPPPSKNLNVCDSKACEESAKLLLESMDFSVDPCKDFFKYACGGWIEKHPIPEEKSRYTTFDVAEDELSDKLQEQLTNITSANHTTAVLGAATLYQGCIDEVSREAVGLDPLKNVFEEFGGWPMINSTWNETGYVWHEQVAAITRVIGIPPVITADVQTDANETSRHIICVEDSGFGLGRNQLINLTSSERNIEIIASYKAFILSTAKALNPDVDESKLNQDAEDIIEFESQLAQLSRPPEDKRDASTWYHKMTVAQMQEVTENTYFSWLDFLNNILKDFPGVTDDTDVLLPEIDYVKDALKLASNKTTRTLANYIGWILAMSIGQETTKEMRDIEFAFERVQSGVEKPKKLIRSCTGLVVDLMGHAVGRLYVDQYFPEEDKKDAEKLVDDIRSAYELTLKNNVWMDQVTTNKALEKLKAMVNLIGYPEWIKNDTTLNEYYNETNDIQKEDYFTSLLKVRKAMVAKALQKWNKPTNRTTDWVTQAPVVNAFYDPSANTITFPAGILNLPFYQFGRSLALNFGGVGSIIGHEVSHGFDDEGAQYDGEGNLVNWWSEETKEKFDEKADCFRIQYSSYVDPVACVNLNGNNTVGENIADNGGLRNSFIAYMLDVLLTDNTNTTNSKKLPGLDATPQQLFFLGYASTWCGSERKEALEMSIQYDAHSPDQFRVTVPLSNSEAFAEAYKCPLGSPMNPEKKCLLW